jgi:hypothetical protein
MNELDDMAQDTNATAADGARIGLDVGTSKIAMARGPTRHAETEWQLNAFIAVPYSPLTQRTLVESSVPYYREADELIVYGNMADRFAHMFNAEARRPMAKGLLNPNEPTATRVLEAILDSIVPDAREDDELLAFSVPAPTLDAASDLTYHEGTLTSFLQDKGYAPLAVNEGVAVVLAELASEHFTGIGISCGGGMCNAALCFLSIPSVTFSIPQGGDYIDASVGSVVREASTRVKAIKEESLDLSRTAGNDKVDRALHIYYDKLISTLVDQLHVSLARGQRLPRIDRPLKLALAGGTAKPRGFRERFEEQLRSRTWPFEISEVQLASDPQSATARGALVAALAERRDASEAETYVPSMRPSTRGPSRHAGRS